MIVPFLIFWLLIFFGRDELGFRGILIAVGVWVVLLIAFFGLAAFHVSPLFVVVPQSLLDIVLILKIFGGDIRIK